MTDKYFHKSCFQCVKCNKSLAVGGFFAKDGNYYCTSDYQKAFGTKCAVCQNYVEGEVVSTMGNTYHQKCFTCTKCTLPFESGSKVFKSFIFIYSFLLIYCHPHLNINYKNMHETVELNVMLCLIFN